MKAPLAAVALPVLLLLSLGAVAAGRPDGALIENSGSTNAPASRLRVWSDGRIRVEGEPTARAAGTVAPGIIASFFRHARAAKGSRGSAEPCMKSASFGARIVVAYHGWRSPDLGCPQTGALAKLAADVEALTSAVAVQGRAGRTHLPINEPRRIPQERPPHPAVTPTP